MRTRAVTITAAVVALFALSACGGGQGVGKSRTGTVRQHSVVGQHTAPAPAPATVSVKVADSRYGRVLVDQSGRTLYAFAKDRAGVSECSRDCVAAWPAAISRSAATAGEGAEKSLLGQTERADGVNQVVYNDWPLYYFAGDSMVGDMNGQGVGAKWFAVSGDGQLVKKRPH